MTLDDRVRDIARRLIDRCKANECYWHKAGVFADGGQDLYELILATTSVTIGFRTPTSQQREYLFQLRSAGRSIAELRTADERSNDWRLFAMLYAEAQRASTGPDNALKEIESHLNHPGPLGHLPPPAK